VILVELTEDDVDLIHELIDFLQALVGDEDDDE
jgi:hypothetical protein